ncbi:MAG: hypothetical protein J6A03_12305 [Lachnospiraceae bacterium]|nr:hypothetical protein [Lachnospiraceae bacterium]
MTVEQYTCTIAYKEIPMQKFMERYHFEPKDREMVEATVRFVCELVKVQMWIGYQEDGVVCAITLGKQYDKLSDVVTEHLLLSYCMECVGMEMLSKAYERVNQHVHERKGCWIGDYQFPEGGKGQKQLEKLQEASIEWKNGMMHPAKSVVLVAEYVEEQSRSGCEHCMHCGNVDCVFRKRQEKENMKLNYGNASVMGTQAYSYGVQRIFGNDRKLQG